MGFLSRPYHVSTAPSISRPPVCSSSLNHPVSHQVHPASYITGVPLSTFRSPTYPPDHPTSRPPHQRGDTVRNTTSYSSTYRPPTESLNGFYNPSFECRMRCLAGELSPRRLEEQGLHHKIHHFNLVTVFRHFNMVTVRQHFNLATVHQHFKMVVVHHSTRRHFESNLTIYHDDSISIHQHTGEVCQHPNIGQYFITVTVLQYVDMA